ncbi:S49 family peptidase [Marinomonas ostreistagni]|uniref:S49 family peptidase n=1 Tax=Marinomonas ostreistagni TaxID=359209 RepID=UPI00194F3ADE|nr:S49 family peptidase [Marinomonas ostreistagni]MBM6549996.1 S49 family peptidase [Marinomonas ostreistagni]
MSWTEDEDQKTQQSESASSTKPSGQAVNADSQVVEALKEVLGAQVTERRRARRWKIFFRLVYLLIFVGVMTTVVWQSDVDDMAGGDSVAVMRMQGVIGAQAEIDANEYVALLDEIYANPSTKALLIEMNSPGGSPVHAGILYDAITQYRAQRPEVPVWVVVEDMAASGGYYIAAAADQIIVDKASLVGSIGVVSGGFEASGLIEKLGVKRRLFTAGENKAFLDPFSPMSEEATQSWQAVLDQTHAQFINAVKAGRGDKLADNEELFSGMVFTGAQAVELGLADGYGYSQQLLNAQFSELTPTYYQPYQEPWEKMAKELGVEFSQGVQSTLQGLR